jgi:hypothetical protein
MAEKPVHEPAIDEIDTTPPPDGQMIPDAAWNDILEGKAAEVEPDPDDDLEPAKEPPVVDPKKEPEPEKKEEPVVADDEVDPIEAVLAGINETLANLDKKIAPADTKPGPAKEPEIAEGLKALLEHEDATVRDGAKALLERQNQQDQRLARLEKHEYDRDLAVEVAKVQTEIDAVADKYSLTEEQCNAVSEYLESDPMLASTLTFEEGTRRKFPDAKPRTQAPKTEEPKKGPTVKVPSQPREAGALVIDRAAVAGATPKPERAPDGETMEQAVERGYKKVFSA